MKSAGFPTATIAWSLFSGKALLENVLTSKSEVIWDGNDISNNPTDITIDGANVPRSIQLAGYDSAFDFVKTSQTIPFKFSPGLSMIIGSGFLGLNLLKKRINK